MAEIDYKIKSGVVYPPPPTKIVGTNGVNVELSGDTLSVSGSSSINVGDVFYTTRSDDDLNGAVTCDGKIYNCCDFTGTNSVPSLLKAGKLPYIPLSDYQQLLDRRKQFNINNYGCILDGNWMGGNFGAYATPDKEIPFSQADSWEFYTIFKYEERITQGSGQAIIGGSDKTKDQSSFILFVSTDSYIKCSISSNGTSWDIASNLSTGYKVTSGSVYNISLSFDGTQYTVRMKLETETDYTVYNIAKTAKCFSNGVPALLAHCYSTSPVNYYCNSYIDLTRTGIIINGETYWEGGDGVYPIKSINCFGFDGGNSDTFRVPLIETPRIVVATKEPTTDDPRWYRLYNDSWLEQGGESTYVYANYIEKYLQFVVPFRDTNYTVLHKDGHTGDVQVSAIIEKRQNGIILGNAYNSNGRETWVAYGYAKELPATLSKTMIGLAGMRAVVQLAAAYTNDAFETCTSILPRMNKLENKFQVVNELPLKQDPECLYFVIAKDS